MGCYNVKDVLLFFLNSLSISVCVCVRVRTRMCVCYVQFLQLLTDDRNIGSLGTEVTGCCEPPNVYAGN